MSRAKMSLWFLAAFVVVMVGVNAAFNANIRMTGADNIPHPIEYSIEGRTARVSLLGQGFYLIYPREEMEQAAAQAGIVVDQTVRWAREEAKEIYTITLKKARKVKGGLKDI